MDENTLLEKTIRQSTTGQLLEVYRQIWLGPANTIGLTPDISFDLHHRIVEELRSRGVPGTELDRIRNSNGH